MRLKLCPLKFSNHTVKYKQTELKFVLNYLFKGSYCKETNAGN